MTYLLKIIAILGLLLISYGVSVKKATKRDEIFVAGGVCLLIYSIYLRDPIFIPLQIVFIISSLYEIAHTRGKNRTHEPTTPQHTFKS